MNHDSRAFGSRGRIGEHHRKKMRRRFCCEEKTLKSERECYGVPMEIGLQRRCRCRSIRSSHGAMASSMVLFARDTRTFYIAILQLSGATVLFLLEPFCSRDEKAQTADLSDLPYRRIPGRHAEFSRTELSRSNLDHCRAIRRVQSP